MFDARVKRFFRLRDKKNHARLYYFLIVLICHAKVYWLWVAVRLDWSAVTTKILTFYFPLLLGGGASQIINFMAPIRFEYSIHGFHVYIYIDYFLKCEDSESHNDQRDTLKKRQQHTQVWSPSMQQGSQWQGWHPWSHWQKWRIDGA